MDKCTVLDGINKYGYSAHDINHQFLITGTGGPNHTFRNSSGFHTNDASLFKEGRYDKRKASNDPVYSYYKDQQNSASPINLLDKQQVFAGGMEMNKDGKTIYRKSVSSKWNSGGVVDKDTRSLKI